MAAALLALPEPTCDAFRPSPPDPLELVVEQRDDADRLGDSIVDLSARIQAATYHLLVMLHEFDELEGWSGFLSCAHWLNYRTGLNMGAAREKVRVARALPVLPKISEAMRQGRLSYSKVRALTRIATPRIEERLLNFALVATAAQTERMVRSWRRADRILEAERDEYRQESRTVQMYTDEEGMLVIRARLDPETGAVFRRAMDAASDRLYDEAPEGQVRTRGPGVLEPPAPLEHRRADALALVAETALAADLDPGTRGDRYQVVVHVDEPVLRELEPDTPGTPGMSMLEDGVDVSAEMSRRLSCDCATVKMTHDSDGNVLDVGRKTRTISPAMRRALRHRDRSGRYPGCGVTVCEGHHVRHWADGGDTKLNNLILLCRRHHRTVHEEGFRVELLPDGEARFHDDRGREIPQAPPPPCTDYDSAWELLDYAEPDGVPIDNWTGSASSDSTPVDWGHVMDVLYESDDDDVDGCAEPEEEPEDGTTRSPDTAWPPNVAAPHATSRHRGTAPGSDADEPHAHGRQRGAEGDEDVSAATHARVYEQYEPALDWETAMAYITVFDDDMTAATRESWLGLKSQGISVREFGRMWGVLYELRSSAEADVSAEGGARLAAPPPTSSIRSS
jgi:hypothetical protein